MASGVVLYRGTSLTRKRAPLGPYSRTMPRALWRSWGGWLFVMSEVPLHARYAKHAARLNPVHQGTFFFFFITLKPRVE